VCDQANTKRLAGLAALAAGVALFVSSLLGIASMDTSLSAAAPQPPVTQELRVVERLDERDGSGCPGERAGHVRDL
jgi:hypothetical protein